MKEEKTLFNPLPLPDNLLEAVHQEIKAATEPTERRRRLTTTRATRSTVKAPGLTQRARKPKITGASIKARLQRKLSQLNPGQLKRVLRTCGVGLVVATSIALLAKFTPIVLLLIAALGLTWLLSHSDQMFNWRRI